jgi:hypothetical protein
MLLFADKSSRDTAERVRLMQRANVADGNWQWPPPPGYSIAYRSPENKRNRRPQLCPDEKAPLIERLFERAAEGNESLRELRDFANSIGLTSTKGGALSRTHVHKLLTNPAYVGDIAYGRRPHGRFTADKRTRSESEWLVVRDAHPAIVERETFAAVQTNLKQHKRFQAQVRGTAFLLTGAVRCGHCGSRMYGATGGTRGNFTYNCTRGQGYGDCALKSVGGKGVDAFVKGALQQMVLTPEGRRQVEQSVIDQQRASRTEAGSQRRNLLRDRQRHEAERERLAREYLARGRGVVSPVMFTKIDSTEVAAIEIIDRALAALEASSALDVSRELAFIEAFDWSKFDEEAWRDAVGLLIERVTVRRLGQRTWVKGRRGSLSNVEIEIAWTPTAQVIFEAILQTV